MRPEVVEQYESFPDPSPQVVPVVSGQLDRMDDALHYGWSWHRYRFCYRRPEGLRILDAGCGTGLSTVSLARLNPGSRVVGIDASARALEVARQRAEAAEAKEIEFQRHDLEQPLPPGPFDFITCRRVLGQVDDPVRVLINLARALDDRGLILATFPSRPGRQVARQLRLATGVICPPGSGLVER